MTIYAHQKKHSLFPETWIKKIIIIKKCNLAGDFELKKVATKYIFLCGLIVGSVCVLPLERHNIEYRSVLFSNI